MRKVWVTLAVAGTLLVGLAMAFAFGKMTDGMWTGWCLAVAGDGLGYVAGNVVSKKIDKEQ